MAERIIYKIIDNTPSVNATETELNELALDGWRVVGFTQHQILLKGTADEKELLTEDSGQG